LTAQEVLSVAEQEALTARLSDESAAVRVAAAAGLGRHNHVERALPVLIDDVQHEDLSVVLHAARAIELLGNRARDAVPAMQKVVARSKELRPADTPATFVLSGEQDLAMFASFAARSFLSKVASDGWVKLFDGETLEGWTARADGTVKVVDGEIQILSKGKNLWLVHDKKYDDFELVVEALMPKSGYNSGIGIRCSGKGRPQGYQCEIENNKSGMIYAIGSGWVWPRTPKEKAKFKMMAGACFQVGKWNNFRIRCQGQRIQIWVNGVQTADVTDERFSSGSIALQHHGKGDVHRFQNIRIRELK
jgi:hypothetical protein